MRWRRRPVVAGLTLACILVHAAALDQLASTRRAEVAEQAPLAAAKVLNVRTIAMPSAEGNTVAVAPSRASSDMHVDKVVSVVHVPRRSKAPDATAPPLPLAALADSVAPMLPSEQRPSANAHLPTHVLDVSPVPVSAPDERHVEDGHRSGLPIRVRLFIEDDGKVSDALVLDPVPGDEQAAQSVLQMFRETAFIPGRLG